MRIGSSPEVAPEAQEQTEARRSIGRPAIGRDTSGEGISCSRLEAGYDRGPVVKDVSLDLRTGEAVAVVGPNGAGKTTLLKAVAGVLTPSRGLVTLDGMDITKMSRRRVARSVAFVPQRMEVGFGLTGGDVVMLGRTPYLGFLGTPAPRDMEAVRDAVRDTNVEDLVDRPFTSLSGGEAQRVVLAMAIAQETPYLLLDEPTVHLDLGQQWRVLERLVELRRKRNVAVLAVLHDLNLASLGFDRMLMMSHGRVLATGPPSEVLTLENIRFAFGAPVRVWSEASQVHVLLERPF